MPKLPPTIAVTSTLAMVRTAESRGIETADILETAGLTRDLLDDPDLRLPGGVVLCVWNALRERAADPVLQLAAPASLPFGAYRVIEYLVAVSGTLGDGVDRFARFFRLIADAVSLSIVDAGEERHLCASMADGRAVPPLYVEYIFAALVGRIRAHIRPALAVLRVEFRQPEPADAMAYGAFFRCPVRFGAAGDRLCFAAEEWFAPMDTADDALLPIIEDHARILARRMTPVASGFPGEVEKAIAAGLPEGASAQAVARALHMSVRTLQRKLIADGATFRDVVDGVRRRLAEEYLRDRRVSTAEVAFLLGFGDQSSFNRAFRRWTGDTPGRWRRHAHSSGSSVA